MKKKILILSSVVLSALLMAFNVTTSQSGTDFSVTGITVLASSGSSCGFCDYSNPDIPKGFCNFTVAGSCGGNDGSQCGSVPCS